MQTKKSAIVPIEVWDEMKNRHLAGEGLRFLGRRYGVSEGTVLAYAFRHRWSDAARLCKKVCATHQCYYRKCPDNCGFALLWQSRIKMAQKRRATLSKARRIKKSRLLRVAAKQPPKVRPCIHCQSELPKHQKKFCNASCQVNHHKANKPPPKPREQWVRRGPPKKIIPPRSCVQCGCEFTAPRLLSKMRFCSKACAGASKRKVKPPPIEGNCIICAKHIIFPKLKFCSKSCAKKHERAMDKKLGRKKKPKPRKINPIRPCAICDKEFQPKSFNNRFCSHKCHLKHERKKRRIKDKGKVRKPHQRIKRNLSGRLRELLRRKGQQKQNAISAYMGCTPKQMCDHVEKQLAAGMTWETYGVNGWHLDHIIPCARFDLTKEDHCKVCFNWRNIRPLWGETNYMRQDMLTLEEALNLDPELVKMAADVGVRLWQ